MDNDVFEALRCCVTETKCNNHDCPYESRCRIANNDSQYLQIPKHLALDVIREMTAMQHELDELSYMVYG